MNLQNIEPINQRSGFMEGHLINHGCNNDNDKNGNNNSINNNRFRLNQQQVC